jgi:hypothetical protein
MVTSDVSFMEQIILKLPIYDGTHCSGRNYYGGRTMLLLGISSLPNHVDQRSGLVHLFNMRDVSPISCHNEHWDART